MIPNTMYHGNESEVKELPVCTSKSVKKFEGHIDWSRYPNFLLFVFILLSLYFLLVV